MAITTSFGKKAAAAALVALTLGAGMTMNAGDAEARGGRKGAAIAAGIIGALAVGAIAASASNAHAGHGYDADPGYGYQPAYEPAPVYYHQPAYPVQYQQPVHEYVGPGRYYPQRHYGYRHPRHPGYTETGFAYRGPVCKVKKQTYFDGYGYRVQKVQVCR